MWPSSRLTHTGWFGVAASIQSRRGSSPPQSVWSQSPPVIHVPGGTVAANALMRATNSSRVRGVAQLHRRQTESAIEEVNVRIDEAGYDEPSVEIHGLAAVCLSDVGCPADGDDTVAGNDDRFGFGLRGIAGPDPPVHERHRDHGASGVPRCPGPAAHGGEHKKEGGADAIRHA